MDSLLLVDVDGVLDPAAPRDWLDRSKYRRRKVSVREGGLSISIAVWLDRHHGKRLCQIAESTGAQLVWCTSWNEHAGRLIARHVGLPHMPYIYLPPGVHELPEWKYDAVARYAGESPVAWLDDDFGEHPSADFLARRDGLPTLLHQVDSTVGLCDHDFDAVESWLTAVKSGRRPRTR